jgi:hypothetical protein
VLFEGVKLPGRVADTRLHLIARFRMSGAILPGPYMHSWRAQGKLHFYVPDVRTRYKIKHAFQKFANL